MRRLSANYIFTTKQNPLKNGIVELSDSGTVLNVIDTKGQLAESRNLEFYNGVIVPGFVNTHCHLELSDLKGKIEQGKGLPDFIESVFYYKRSKKTTDTHKAIDLQDFLMQKNGIVAVGDICNTADTIETKKKSKIYYHTFVEAMGLENRADEIIKKNLELKQRFIHNKLPASIVYHAPYSVSKDLFQKITELAISDQSVLSIHNQESDSENEMFISATGHLISKLKSLGINLNHWSKTKKNSLQSILEYLPKENHILLVHNTYSSEDDLQMASAYFKNLFWCLCPSSNRYIENRLPAIDLFTKYSDRVTLGTDSLASNYSLSILEEMKLIQKEFSQIAFNELLQWATMNGAKALKIDQQYGSIEKGKAPGVNLISHFDFKNMKLTPESEVKTLI